MRLERRSKSTPASFKASKNTLLSCAADATCEKSFNDADSTDASSREDDVVTCSDTSEQQTPPMVPEALPMAPEAVPLVAWWKLY